MITLGCGFWASATWAERGRSANEQDAATKLAMEHAGFSAEEAA